MNEKQKRFCDEYVKNLNAAQAARTVGYSLSSAYKLTEKPELKEYICRQTARINEELQTDTLHVYNMIKGIMEDSNASNKDRLKAAEMLVRLKIKEKETGTGNQVIIMGENYL